ncbi:hypothetical protein GC176_12770 [bacterium]|nr:hypothetical protein [bacterium]
MSSGELSKRAACVEYDIHWDTLKKILSHSEPPGYVLTKKRPSKLEPFVSFIHEMLDGDRKVHRKQRHTAQRVFERLRDEHGDTGGVTIVKQAVRAWREKNREVFLPLSHPPGNAQVDYGFADVVLNDETVKVALFVMTLPYSDAIRRGRFISRTAPLWRNVRGYKHEAQASVFDVNDSLACASCLYGNRKWRCPIRDTVERQIARCSSRVTPFVFARGSQADSVSEDCQLQGR